MEEEIVVSKSKKRGKRGKKGKKQGEDPEIVDQGKEEEINLPELESIQKENAAANGEKFNLPDIVHIDALHQGNKGEKGEPEVEEEEKKEVLSFDDESKEPEELKEIQPTDYYPLEVILCGICALPLEYCQYKDQAVECKEWANENHPNLFAQIYSDNPLNDLPKLKTKKVIKKVKFQEAEIVTITKFKRGGRKFITLIGGLQAFKIDIKEGSKIMGKQLATGSSIVKGEDGSDQQPFICLQGDVTEQISELLLKTYPQLNPSHLQLKEGGNKKKAKKHYK